MCSTCSILQQKFPPGFSAPPWPHPSALHRLAAHALLGEASLRLLLLSPYLQRMALLFQCRLSCQLLMHHARH